MEPVTAAGHELATRGDVRMESREHRLLDAFERRIADSVTGQTCILVISQLAALVTMAASALGLR